MPPGKRKPFPGKELVSSCPETIKRPKSQGKFKFSFIPDPSLYQGGTWREEEILGHNSLAYPLAELVDNSLTATKNNSERYISLKIIRRSNREFCIIVFDNGEGMDPQGLQNLAVFAHAPKYRSQNQEVLDTIDTKKTRYINSMISRFGVGLKNAAFHIGDDMIVITKEKKSDQVLEFRMNIAEMRQRYKIIREKAYEGEVSTRLPGDINNSILDFSKPSKALKKIFEEEKKNESFTTIVISSIKENHSKCLSDAPNRELLSKNLASLYHYYLNGKYGKISPDRLISENALDIVEGNIITKVNIEMYYICDKSGKTEKTNLVDVNDDIQSLNHLLFKGTPFQFEICIPKKDPVIGIVFYYPCLNELETVPPVAHNLHLGEVTNSKDESQKEILDFKLNENNSIFEPIFTCFWQGRQIPFTSVSILNFMCNIPPYYRRRLRGALFFNESFSVNPQKNIFNEDLEDLLNLRYAKVTEMKDNFSDNINICKRFPKRKDKKFNEPSSRFFMWVKKMSDLHDREIVFMQELSIKSNNFNRCYSKAKYGEKTFNENEVVMFENKEKNRFFGKIIHFIKRNNYENFVTYNRLPYHIYKEKEYTAPIRQLVKDKNKQEIDLLYKEKRKMLLSEYPDMIEINFNTKLYKDIDPVLKKVVFVNYKFPDCYIKIRGTKTPKNPKGKSITSVNLLEKKCKSNLIVVKSLQYYDGKTNKWILDEKVNGKKEYECNPLSKKYEEKGRYYFKPLRLDKPGKCRISFEVYAKPRYDKTKPIISRKIEILVKTGPPKKIMIPSIAIKASIGEINEFKDQILPLEIKGDNESSFKVCVKDVKVDYSQVNFENSLKFNVTSKLKKEKDAGCFSLEKFLVIPNRKKVKLPKTGQIITLNCCVTVRNFATIIKKIQMTFYRGVAVKIVSSDKKFSLQNRMSLSGKFFYLLDNYGNECISQYGFDNLILKVKKSPGIKVNESNVLEYIGNNKYSLNDFKIDIITELFKTKKNMPYKLPFEVFASKNRKKVVEIKSYQGIITVYPSKNPTRIILSKNLITDNNIEEKQLKLIVGNRTKLYVIFLDQSDRIVKNIKLLDIKKFVLEICDLENKRLLEDENGNFYIEMMLPKNTKDAIKCVGECVTVYDSTMIYFNVNIFPLYGDPVKWYLKFIDKIKCGEKLEKYLSIYFLDKYDNCTKVDDFENPLESNPNLKTTCVLEDLKIDKDNDRGCIFFSEGIIKGSVGRHYMEIEDNIEYGISKSNPISFQIICGDPEKLNVLLFSNSNKGVRDLKTTQTCDEIRFEAHLLDCFENIVNVGNYTLEAELYCDSQKVDTTIVKFMSGICGGKFKVFLNSAVIGQELKLKLHVVENRKIKYEKKLRVTSTPKKVKSIDINLDPDVKKIKICDLCPKIVCKVNMESPNEIFKGSTDNFIILIRGKKPKSDIYNIPISKNQTGEVVFEAKKKFITTGEQTIQVVYNKVINGNEIEFKSAVYSIYVESGPPVSLILCDKNKFSALSAANVSPLCKISDMMSFDAEDRDGYSFNTAEKPPPFPEIQVEIAKTFREENNKDLEMPKLIYCNKNPGQIENLSIKENSGRFEGQCSLRFSVESKWKKRNPNSIFANLNPVYIGLFFSNDFHRVSVQKKLEYRKQLIEKDIKKTINEIQISSLDTKKIEALKRSGLKVERKYPKLAVMSRNKAKSEIEYKIDQIKKTIQKETIMHSLKFFRDKITYQEGYIGRLGEIFSADSVAVARCAMFLLGSRLEHHLTRGRNSLATRTSIQNVKTLKNFACLEIGLLPKKSFVKNLKNFRLPHEGHFSFSRGNPCFLVQRLNLRAGYGLNQEEFEAIILYFLNKTLLMDTIDNAIIYERNLVDKKIFWSPIMTLDGYKVQLVKMRITEFEKMREKQRSISVYRDDIERRILHLKDVVLRDIETYFEEKTVLQSLILKNKLGQKKREELSDKLKSLQKERLFVLKEIKKYSPQIHDAKMRKHN